MPVCKLQKHYDFCGGEMNKSLYFCQKIDSAKREIKHIYKTVSYDRNLTRHFSKSLASSSADSTTLRKLNSKPVVRSIDVITAQKCGNSDFFPNLFPLGKWKWHFFFFLFFYFRTRLMGTFFEGGGSGGVKPKLVSLQVNSSLICACLGCYGTSPVSSLKHIIPLFTSTARLALTCQLQSPFCLICCRAA